ncbi:MAG: efflux RND transporter periplasmic adaptor subunit [Xanthobacteraceae bacterium]|nr:efflux RND transporter periplasmic adaptor subunit [Xanthobacteraceae bacterium]
MTRRILLIGVAAAVALAGGYAAMRGAWSPPGAVAQAPKGKGKGGSVAVDVAQAVKKKVPVRIDLLGNVTPIAQVAVKPRIDSEIIEVHFSDGAIVRKGDMLFTLDHRALDAQIRQTQGILNGARSQLEQAQRDVERYEALVAKNATTLVTLNNAKTQVNIFTAAVESNSAQLELLRVQRDYTFIRAPITGRVSMATAKVGNFARQADPIPLATIIQVAPVYVTFALPQRSLPELRQAITNETATIQAVVPGDGRHASGQVTMVENTVDPATGTVPVRATMPNTDELLWPGTLVQVRLVFREEDAVAVPSAAIQVAQAGPFVFVVKNGVATVTPVKVARVLESETVLGGGLEGGEMVVIEGHLRLTNGTRVSPRESKAGT